MHWRTSELTISEQHQPVDKPDWLIRHSSSACITSKGMRACAGCAIAAATPLHSTHGASDCTMPAVRVWARHKEAVGKHLCQCCNLAAVTVPQALQGWAAGRAPCAASLATEAPCSAMPSVMLCRRWRPDDEGLGLSGSTMPCGMKVSFS